MFSFCFVELSTHFDLFSSFFSSSLHWILASNRSRVHCPPIEHIFASNRMNEEELSLNHTHKMNSSHRLGIPELRNNIQEMEMKREKKNETKTGLISI